MKNGAAIPNNDCADAFVDYQLLLAFLRQALHPIADAQSLIPSHIAVCWPRLLSLAHRHEVLPLLNLGLRNVSGVPAPVRRWLQIYCRKVIAQNLRLASELVSLVELLEASKVAVVPFKGPAWTVTLYGNLAIRQITDLDIFIDKSQAGLIFELLTARGYVLSAKSKARSSDQIRLNDKDVELLHCETGVLLEVHWAVCEPWFDRRLCSLNLWKPVSTMSLLNRSVPLPSPEDLVFLLAIHGFRHRWESLKWVCDIAAAVRAFPDLNWAALLSKAARLSRKRMVLLPLAIVQQLFNTPLPDCVLTAIAQDPNVTALATQLQKAHYATNDASSSNPIRRFVYLEGLRMRSRESFLERLSRTATLFLALFKPSDKDRQYFSSRPLPEPLYWLIRPFRLLNNYGVASVLEVLRRISPLRG